MIPSVNKDKLKKSFAAFSVVLVELALMVAATAAFITAFRYVDGKHPDNTAAKAPVESVASSSASSAVGSSPESTPEPQPDDWRLILVNYDHKLPDRYPLTIVHELGVDIDSRILEPFKAMRGAAQRDHVKLWLSSAYRSPERQQVLFEQEIAGYSKKGLDYVNALAQAEASVARGGYSEHNSGLAIDLNGVQENFGGTPASDWLEKHAAEYGFILRYPADKQSITKIRYEAWHYRYVGVEHAKKMTELGMCLEEYVDYRKENQGSGN